MRERPSITRSPRRRLTRAILTPLIVALAVMAVVLEVTIWRWLTVLGQIFAHLAVFAWLERLVERLSPAAVVAVFVVPFIPIVPLVKIGELWLIHNHHYVLAAIMIVGTKVVGVAFSTRVLSIARPKMLRVHWFAVSYGWAVSLLALGHQILEQVPAWFWLRAALHRLRERLHSARAAAWLAVRTGLLASSKGQFGRRLEAARRKLRSD